MLIVFVALVTIFIVATTSAETELSSFVRRSQMEEIGALAEDLADYYITNNSWDGVEELFKRHSQTASGLPTSAMTLVDRSMILVYSSNVNLVGVKVALPTEDLYPIMNGNEVVGYLYSRSLTQDDSITIEKQLKDIITRSILSAALISGVVAALLAVVLADQVSKPVNVMIEAAENISHGNLEQRVNVEAYPDLKTLGMTLNNMTEALQNAQSRRRSFTSDIAHELRTPLAVQRSNLEALEDGIYPLELEYLRPIKEQNLLLTRLVEDLRLLSLADSGSLKLNKRMADAATLVESTLNRFESEFVKRNIKVIEDYQDDIPYVEVDPDRIEQIMHNLLQNALRYTPENSSLEVNVTADEEEVVFTLRDHGPGIPPERLMQIFDRFVRGDPGRDRVTGGTGLGLSIARKLALAHGGDLRAYNHEEGGAAFMLILPVHGRDADSENDHVVNVGTVVLD